MTVEHGTCRCGCGAASASGARAVAPGRPAIARRAGTAAGFAAAMSVGLTRHPALQRFTNRRSDDPAMALVDSWSQVLDVLTFYSERLAQEGYLRTARDPRSVIELAQEVGYAPGRGRASATELAFTLDHTVGAPPLVPVPRGTRVASVPGPGQTPQTYETTVDLEARPTWNAVRARSREQQALAPGSTTAYVEGARGDLLVGDAVLLVGREREQAGASQVWAFRLLADVELCPGLDATRLSWTDPLGEPPPDSGRAGHEKVPDPRDARLLVLRRRTGIFGAAAPDHRLIDASVAGAMHVGAAGLAADAGVAAIVVPDTAKDTTGTYSKTKVSVAGPDWPGWTAQAPGQPENTVDLDAVHAEAVSGSWLVLTRSGVTACYRILQTREVSRTDYTLNAKVSRLTLQGPFLSKLFSSHVRETTGFVGSELLPLATAPAPLPVRGDRITLAAPVPTLSAGRTVVVRGPRPVVRVAEGVRTLVAARSGETSVPLHPGDELEVVGATVQPGGAITWSTTAGDVTAGSGQLSMTTPADDATVHAEPARIAAPTPEGAEVGELVLAGALAGCYDPEAVRILANVAAATHGETRTQVLGGGDAGRPFQRFTLAQQPLTYVVAGSSGAVVSTLEVRVDGRVWAEVTRLYGAGPDDEVYATRCDDEGVVTVLFGDGRTGARLPTGTNNVTATYRLGTGAAGRLPADRLTLLMTRPLGVRSVGNPLTTGLAADPEPSDDIRHNAARSALTMERVVSLRDVEDFARAVPGVGKALARWLWDGRTRLVHLTVAATGGQALDEQARADLETAIRAAGDHRLALVVQAAEVVPVRVSAGVVVDPAYESVTVRGAVADAVSEALSFDARDLGQPMTANDVVRAAHAVPGVLGVNVTVPVADVPSFAARMEGTERRPAQLVVLAAGGLSLVEVTS